MNAVTNWISAVVVDRHLAIATNAGRVSCLRYIKRLDSDESRQ